MYSVWLTLLASAEVAEGAPTSPFDVNFGLFVWTWLVFGALFLVLKKYAWPAILSATEAREQKIAGHLAETERLHAEAKAAAESAMKSAAEARASAQSLLAEARSSAEKERAGLLAKTKHEQEEVLARARREIVAEKERALVEIRREAVDLSLAAATRLIEQRLDGEADRKLVTDYLDSVRTLH
ncbi:MAG: F0F1 ATP synthase subunit B [Gemmatimonadota bacterium]